MKKHCHYLVVDDDATNNLICDYTIRRANKNAFVHLFNNPETALAFIEKAFFPNVCKTILFLDMNLPSMTGFEFLEKFEKFEVEIKSQYLVFILTSSIEDFTAQALKFPIVKGFLPKPLQLSYLEKIHEEAEKMHN